MEKTIEISGNLRYNTFMRKINCLIIAAIFLFFFGNVGFAFAESEVLQLTANKFDDCEYTLSDKGGFSAGFKTVFSPKQFSTSFKNEDSLKIFFESENSRLVITYTTEFTEEGSFINLSFSYTYVKIVMDESLELPQNTIVAVNFFGDENGQQLQFVYGEIEKTFTGFIFDSGEAVLTISLFTKDDIGAIITFSELFYHEVSEITNPENPHQDDDDEEEADNDDPLKPIENEEKSIDRQTAKDTLFTSAILFILAILYKVFKKQSIF